MKVLNFASIGAMNWSYLLTFARPLTLCLFFFTGKITHCLNFKDIVENTMLIFGSTPNPLAY